MTLSKDDRLWHEREEFEDAARFSDDVLRQAGPFARIPPNILTLCGGLLTIPMIFAFRANAVLLGSILFTLCSLIDWLDGALARYQQRLADAGRLQIALRSEWIRLGPTELGKKMDPVFDKFRYYGALLPLGWHTLPHTLIWISIGVALALTVFRELVRLRWNIKAGANSYGKIKVYLEIGVIACLVFRTLGVPPELLIFLAATGLGATSFVSQGWSIHRQLKQNRSP